jgi:hypothetical protein
VQHLAGLGHGARDGLVIGSGHDQRRLLVEAGSGGEQSLEHGPVSQAHEDLAATQARAGAGGQDDEDGLHDPTQRS